MGEAALLKGLATLNKSTDMDAVHGSVDLAVPRNELWSAFIRANCWPAWNSCFCWVWNRELVIERQLIWCFNPIRRHYLYRMPAIARIISMKAEESVTWEVTALPGFYAQHTYSMEDIGNGRTRFGSWEKACGWSFRLTKRFWIAHFKFVRAASLDGARSLEEHYSRYGELPHAVSTHDPV